MTIIGIDPHTHTHTAVALDASGKRLGHLTFANDPAGLAALQRWLDGYAVERCAVEGASNRFSYSLTQTLLARGHLVVDVHPNLTSQYRSKRGRAKSDLIDAETIARVTLANPALPSVTVHPKIAALKTLSCTRELLVEQRKALRATLSTMTLAPAQQALQQVIEALSSQIGQLAAQMRGLVAELMSELLQVPGIGVVLAATLLAEAGDVRRFQSQHSFAMFAGCAPIERSSGGCRRRQLNVGGNRRLNRTFHMLAIVRLRYEATQAYIAKKRTEGKTLRAALRCLKTHLARAIFRYMRAVMTEHPERWATP